MRVVIQKSPKPTKKYRATFDSGGHVDFGGAGYSDYTLHKDRLRMRRYIIRHGGIIPRGTGTDVQDMLRVVKSTKEVWNIRGVRTAGFWSRWLLWSLPSLASAVRFMEKKFDMHIRIRSK